MQKSPHTTHPRCPDSPTRCSARSLHRPGYAHQQQQPNLSASRRAVQHSKLHECGPKILKHENSWAWPSLPRKTGKTLLQKSQYRCIKHQRACPVRTTPTARPSCLCTHTAQTNLHRKRQQALGQPRCPCYGVRDSADQHLHLEIKWFQLTLTVGQTAAL
jgi:hypothetical protein